MGKSTTTVSIRWMRAYCAPTFPGVAASVWAGTAGEPVRHIKKASKGKRREAVFSGMAKRILSGLRVTLAGSTFFEQYGL
jgi:hypothetical protein